MADNRKRRNLLPFSSFPQLALVPLKDDRLLFRPLPVSEYKNPLPFVLPESERMQGRLELFHALSRACSCSKRCPYCQQAFEGAIRWISRSLFRLEADGEHLRFTVPPKRSYTLICVRINGKPAQSTQMLECGDIIRWESPEGSNAWSMTFQVMRLIVENGYIQCVASKSTADKNAPAVPESNITEADTKPAPTSESNPTAKRSRPMDNEPSPNNSPHLHQLERPFSLYFVRKGMGMSKQFLEGPGGLLSHVEKRGAKVVHRFDPVDPPTHVIVDTNQVEATAVAEELGFDTVKELERFLTLHRIKCMQRKWAAKGNKYRHPPFVDDFTLQYSKLCMQVPLDSQSLSFNESPIQFPEEKKLRIEHMEQPTFPNNERLAGLFIALSKEYQKAPWDEHDEWKEYMFHRLSGRIRRLPFEAVNKPSVLTQISDIKGFGKSSMDIIKEYLATGGECTRLRLLREDPRRRAMKQFMGIYGVGPKKAKDLVTRHYLTIEQLEDDVKAGKEKLERNQLIGLLCYQDINDKMCRDEAETILHIVDNAVKERLPSSEVQLMGSYRRGATQCGDVDILILHKDFQESVPSRLLGKIVDTLCARGHIIHHLTFISGMNPELFETLPPEAIAMIKDSSRYSRAKQKHDKFSSTSWMGIFRSPKVEDKVRRVDIKFYPFQEHAFASLYFTGNGHFNRSMRLWAAQRKGYLLDDHGLYDRQTKARITELSGNGEECLFQPINEAEIFKKLGIAWKEPHERDGFDAVEGVDGSKLDFASPLEFVRAFKDLD